jgi:hypothetical protein
MKLLTFKNGFHLFDKAGKRPKKNEVTASLSQCMRDA